MHRRPAPRRLALEPLEDRALMAGNVTAALRGGDLLVGGDRLDNQVVLSQPAPGTLRLTGLDGTTVNGRPSVDFPGRAADVEIRMRQGGADQVSVLGPIRLRGELEARLGAGRFVLDGTSGPVRVGGDLDVRTGPGGDVTVRNDVRIDGDAAIDAGGAAHVVAGQAALPDYRAATFTDGPAIDNPYLPFVVGTKYTYETAEIDEAGNEVVTETTVVEVLAETKTIDGVQVRVVRDREFAGGLLLEDTFDWFAQDDNGNVWYFGEDVTNYHYDDAGNLVGTDKDGSWVTGVNGARAGVVMGARPRAGDRYYQEFVPAVVSAPVPLLDQGTVLATDETATVPAGTFGNVVRTEDSAADEPDDLENKWYAPGLGLIREFDYDYLTGAVTKIVRLLSAELNGQAVTQVVPPTGFTGTNATGPVTPGNVFEGTAVIRARGSVIVRGTTFEEDANLNSRTDVAAIESWFDGRAWLQAPEVVSLRTVAADEEVRIRGSGDVYVFGSDLEGRTDIRFGAGDNTLAVADSWFDRLTADGGPGANTFEDRGGNVFGELRLKRFATPARRASP